MGKREIGQLQPFELAISIMIADLASSPMADTGVPISNGIIPILGLLIMHLIISTINIKSIKAREVICGKPRILIYRGKIDEGALIKETSGQITVIQKPDKRQTTPEDFGITPDYEGLPYDLVVDR